jgi:hypothetical protein
VKENDMDETTGNILLAFVVMRGIAAFIFITSFCQ